MQLIFFFFSILTDDGNDGVKIDQSQSNAATIETVISPDAVHHFSQLLSDHSRCDAKNLGEQESSNEGLEPLNEIQVDGPEELKQIVGFLKDKRQRAGKLLDESNGEYMFDAKLYCTKTLMRPGHSRRYPTEYSCSYPGVSWNTRMQSWLVYFEDGEGRRSRTFNPKRFTQAQLETLPEFIRSQATIHVRRIRQLSACCQ